MTFKTDVRTLFGIAAIAGLPARGWLADWKARGGLRAKRMWTDGEAEVEARLSQESHTVAPVSVDRLPEQGDAAHHNDNKRAHALEDEIERRLCLAKR